MRRHELDPISLTFGFAFAALGLLFLLGQADQAFRLHWVWPLLLLALGAGILLDIALGRRRTPDPGVAPGPDPAPEVASDLDAWTADPAAAPDPDAWPAEPEAAAASEARPTDPAAALDPEPADPGVAAAPEPAAAPEAGPAVDNREHPN
jgi:hypothetical protein